MSDQFERAQALEQKGVKSMNKSRFFDPFGTRFETANEYFEKAINLYKMAQKYNEAAKVYDKVVECLGKMGDGEYEIALAHHEQGKLYNKLNDTDEAADAFSKASSCYAKIGKFHSSAQIEQEIGELLEKDQEMEKALPHYLKAYEYYSTEGSKKKSVDMLEKLGGIYGELGDYEKAVKYFEDGADMTVNDQMLRWGSKRFYFGAALCSLASMGDDVEAKMDQVLAKLEDYEDESSDYRDDYTGKLISAIVTAMTKEDTSKLVKEFSSAVRQFSEFKQLDDWTTDILLKIKKSLEKFQGSDEDI